MHSNIQLIKDWYTQRLTQLSDPQVSDQIQIITPNLRLARFLQTHWPSSTAPSAWLRPNILPLSGWLTHCWQCYQMQQVTEGATSPEYQLLNAHQMIQLWQQVISTDPELEANTFQAPQLIHSIQDAYELVYAFQLDPTQFDTHQAEPGKFKAWYQRFEAQCTQNHWLCPAQLPHFLWTHWFRPTKQALKHLGLFGFQQITPSIKQLIACLSDSGTEIKHLNLVPHSSSPRYLNHYQTVEHELTDAIQWAKQNTQAPGNEHKTIAIIVPHLTQRLSEITAISTQVFNPNAAYFPDDVSHLHQVNISASLALSSYPLVHQSLNLLKWLLQPISQAEFFNNLQSPYARHSDILPQALQLRSRLQAKRSKPARLNDWIAQLKQHQISCDRLETLGNQTPAPNTEQTPNHWRQWAFTIFEHLGWPGAQSLDSHEYQVWQRLIQALNDFPNAVLEPDQVRRPAQWLNLFERLLSQTQFQPQSLSNRVHILGSLEAAGQAFDAIWLTGMDDQTWPSKQPTNPFIPKSLQIKHQMPHCSAEHELTFAQTYLHQLIQSAPQVVFSYANWVEDKPTQPSGLGLALVSSVNHITEKTTSDCRVQPRSQIRYETSQNNYGIPLPITPKEPYQVSGGVYHFKSARQCPFQAYARYRLQLNQIHTPTLLSLTPLEQGNIIHRVMEQAAKHIKHHSDLVAMNLHALQPQLETWIKEAMDFVVGREITLLSELYLSLEINRIRKLVLDWLNLEKTRTPFNILHIEQAYTFNIGPLSLKGRIDRVDQLEGGEKLLLDYKTGQVQLSELDAESLSDPQLPIYLLFAEPGASAVGFAKLSAPKAVLLSIANEGVAIIQQSKPPKNALNPEIKANWKTAILHISKQIESAAAHTAPLDKINTCNRCDYAGLCRIQKNTMH